MDIIVECRRIDIRPVRTPTNPRHGTAYLKHCNRFLPALIATLPDPHRPVITACGDEFDPSATGEGSVNGVDDFAVGTETTSAGAGGEVCVGEGVVGGDGVEEGGEEGPLEVEGGGFVDCGKEAVVGVWWVGTP